METKFHWLWQIFLNFPDFFIKNIFPWLIPDFHVFPVSGHPARDLTPKHITLYRQMPNFYAITTIFFLTSGLIQYKNSLWFITQMPSAHGPTFCRKELWEKVRVVWFFIGVSQRTVVDKTSHLSYDFLLECHLAHKARFFYRSYCVWQWQARSQWWVTSLRFFIGLKSAHTDQFFVVSSSENKKSDRFFIGPKFSTHKPIFTLGKSAVILTTE